MQKMSPESKGTYQLVHGHGRKFARIRCCRELIPLKELYQTGASITLSSDYDADDLSPLLKIQTVLTRKNGINLDSVATVLFMLTKNVAALLKTNTGTLEKGKFADLVVLDKNIFDLPFNQTANAGVLVTIFNGKAV
jgi:predicted amidohydrolase YtcJ